MKHTVSASLDRFAKNLEQHIRLIKQLDNLHGWVENERALRDVEFHRRTYWWVAKVSSSLDKDDPTGYGPTGTQAFIDLLGKLGAV